MSRRTLFICYSHDDQELFDKLRTHLTPWVRLGEIRLWTDREIQAGDDWGAEIDRALAEADAAVVLVSPNLLTSSFVQEVELPRLLAAREERDLRIAPLFLRACNPELVTFDVETGDGRRRIDLSRLQGLNEPSRPLAVLPPAEQDDLLAAAVRKLRRALGTDRAPPPVPKRQVTVRLELRAGTRVVRRIGEPPYYDLHTGRGTIDLAHLAGLGERASEARGRALFEVLLGPEQERSRVLARVYGKERGFDPLRHAFRVRVATGDAELRSLPWTACRWREHLLVEKGWTFEIAARDERPRPVEHLYTPCRAVLATGPASRRTGTFGKGFEGILSRSWKNSLKPTLLHHARTLAELEKELAEPPDLLHVYAVARAAGKDAGSLELLFEDGDGGTAAMPFADLAERLAKRPPRVVVLDTVAGETRAGDTVAGDTAACPPATPIPGVAVLLHLRHREDGRDARGAAGTWWSEVLGEGRDPVRAFCDLPDDLRRRSLLVTDYQEWRLEHSEYVPKVDRPRAHLDRRDQRRVVLEAVEELVRQPRRRVTCLVAYGADGNLVEHFAVQMLATLKVRARDLARLEHHRLALPDERHHLTRGKILETLREILGLQPPEPLSKALEKTRRGGPRAKPVHFFDWGTYGEGHGPALSGGDLEAWIEHCRDDLENACPPRARVLCYLSLVSPPDRHARLQEVISSLKRKYHRPHFELVALPALGRVEADDLLRFLGDENNSSCPQSLLEDHLPERLVAHTGGGFEATVKLLEETERGNLWWELREDLPEVPVNDEIDPEELL